MRPNTGNMNTTASPTELGASAGSALAVSPPEHFTGFKFEHILLSVTIAHNRSIGQFDDSCAHQLQKAMMEYNGILMVDAQAQYKHCSEEQHTEGCECGLCAQVRHEEQMVKRRTHKATQRSNDKHSNSRPDKMP